MGRPREHDEATRLTLLDAAERLLSETGPDAVSVRAVADAAQTTTRAVYSVFGSKAGLLDALGVRLFTVLAEAIDAQPRSADPVANLVGASVQGFRAVMLAHEPLYRLVFGTPLPADGEADAAGTAAFARLEALVKELLSDSATQREIADAALAVHALTEGLAAVELRGALGTPRQARRIWVASITALAVGWRT
jgi:AcrR family transcriptional regulator